MPRSLALVVIAGISAACVVAIHTAAWPVAIVAVVVSGFLTILAGGLVGVPMIPSLVAGFGCVGVFEGAYQGWAYLGWVGIVLGGAIGYVAGILAILLLLMLLHLVLILCGVNPNAGSNTSGQHPSPS